VSPTSFVASSRAVSEMTYEKRAFLMLAFSLPLLLAHAFVPLRHFVHRSDDAYYYFKVAAQFPVLGFWSFDGIHATNGVQPLWAMILSLIATVLHWLGLRDPDLLARIFVALAALLHYASALVLFRLLARTVSTGTAIAAAGALLFPVGIVWARVWGLENSLYALLLTATISYFHLVFLPRATPASALCFGLLLGLTFLARLNAGFLVPCILLYFLWADRDRPLRRRLGLATLAAAPPALILALYVVSNYLFTEHYLPVSGAAKAIWARQYLDAAGVETPLSRAFLSLLYYRFSGAVAWFLTSRALDGLWIAGSRVIFREDSGLPLERCIGILALFVLLPAAFGRPREWLTFLRARLARLAPFSYVLAFGVLDAVVSVYLYAYQLRYSLTRWWFVENEIVIAVIVSTLAVAFMSYLIGPYVSGERRTMIVTAALGLYLVFHAQEMVRVFWSERVEYHDWRLSWNDESYSGARWLSENLPDDALVGSWNAGVLGYYAKQRVVNLDGLINSFELLPYLREKRVADYIRKEGIQYLSDLDMEFKKVRGQLALTEVYSHFSPFMQQHYRIYKVDSVGSAVRGPVPGHAGSP